MSIKQYVLFCLNLLAFNSLFGQDFSEQEKLQGYAWDGSQLTFIFDETLYGVQPKKVFVTGDFRNWDADIHNKEWNLRKQGSLWILTIDNKDFKTVKPNSFFKYRINKGIWLNSPDSDNMIYWGNSPFLKKDEVLRAELKSENLIEVIVSKDFKLLDPNAYQLTTAQGQKIKVHTVIPKDSKTILVVPENPLNKKRVYFLEVPSKNWKIHCSFDGWFKELYSPKELGATVEDGQTTIRLFAPRAELVKIYLYKTSKSDIPFREADMVEDENGVWEITFNTDLHRTYYDFTIHGANDPGNHFYETNPIHINDPYARVSDDTWGKGRIWRKTTPATPLKNGIPKIEDVVAYEVHVQDFTDQLPIPSKHKGTFQGMITKGLKNEKGQKVGFDYLVDLGINVLHLMPVQEYMHLPDKDWKSSFKNDPYMIEQGINEENYQWGYRTSFAMAVESRYRTRGLDIGKEREEFRDLVQAFHDEGIAVIIDIVPNHTAENMNPKQEYFNFNAIDKLYYYRTKDFDHIGEYGNEVKTENRPMTQRWLIDQCLHFINEFGVDGFRIDLAGQIDQQTLTALKIAIGEDKILYGEPWIGSNDPNYENNPDWDWYKDDSPIVFFQDDARNAFKGPVFDLKDKYNDRGWSGGKFDERENVMKGLSAGFKEDKTPISGINYLDIHDNYALADQFATVDFDGRFAVDQDQFKIAATLLYTSLGPIVTHGGTEIMRSKAHCPNEEVVKETKAGYKAYFHGKRDTYNLKTANLFLWETVGQKPTEKNQNDYANMHAFWKGLNQLRLSDYGKVFRISDKTPEDYYKWILPDDQSMLGYIVNDKVMVLINASDEPSHFKNVPIAPEEWKLVGTNEKIDLNGVSVQEHPMVIRKGKLKSISIGKTALQIWVKR